MTLKKLPALSPFLLAKGEIWSVTSAIILSQGRKKKNAPTLLIPQVILFHDSNSAVSTNRNLSVAQDINYPKFDFRINLAFLQLETDFQGHRRVRLVLLVLDLSRPPITTKR